MNNKIIYSQIISKETLIILLYLIGMGFSPVVGVIASLHIIILTIFRKNEWFFKGLFYMIILKSLNPFFHPPSSNFFLVYIFLISSYFIYSFFSTSNLKIYSLEKKFMILLGLFALTSLFGSLYLDFSLIRIFILALIMFSTFRTIYFTEQKRSLYLIVYLIILFIMCSAFLLPFPQGYLMPMGFFKGILNHSQEFGMAISPLLSIYLMLILEKKMKFSIFHFIVLLTGITELIMSASRSAVFAFIGAILVYLILRQSKIQLTIKKMIIFLMGLLVFMGILISFNSLLINKIQSFILKYDQPSAILKQKISVNELVQTREYLIKTSIENFLQHPILGIGFNVQTKFPEKEMDITWKSFAKYIPGTNIMYSRPLEKGNLYTSVFEEGGLIVGLYFIYIWIWLFIKLYSSHKGYLWVPYLTMVINMAGEASFFSVMGLGNLQIFLFAWFFHMLLFDD